MAHKVRYFYAASTSHPELDIEHMISTLAARGWQVAGAGWSSSADWEGVTGTNWVAVDIHEGGRSTGLSVEVHIKDEISAEMWKSVSQLPGAPAESDATGLSILTLSGSPRVELFEALQRFWRVERGAAEFDEVGGFDV